MIKEKNSDAGLDRAVFTGTYSMRSSPDRPREI
jgi:hypothetical protein